MSDADQQKIIKNGVSERMQKSFISLVFIMLVSFSFLPNTLLAEVDTNLDADVESEDGDTQADVDADVDVDGSTEDEDVEANVDANAEGDLESDESDSDSDDSENDGSDSDNNTNVSSVSKLTLTSSKSDVNIGENMNINIQGWDDNGDIIENLSDIQYSVNNESVATVNSNGELIPKTSGTVTVTVTAGDVSENFTFNVLDNNDNNSDQDDSVNGDGNTSLNLTANERELSVGEDLQLSWDGLTDNENVSFELSNHAIASINDDGKLVAKDSGKLTVWLKTDDGRQTQLNLMIHPEADVDLDNLDSIEIDSSKENLNLQETLPLDVDGFDIDGNKLEQVNNATFSVSDESKATIDSNGNLHPKAEGQVTVTANVNGMTDTMDLIIDSDEIEKVDLKAPKTAIGVNEKLNLNVDGMDNQGDGLANLTNVEFKVSDNTVATINDNGQLVPKTSGTVTVWAMLDGKQDGLTVDITGDSNVNLDDTNSNINLDQMSDISLESSKVDMNLNEQLKLWVHGLDEDGNKIGSLTDVWFDVSNEDIAEVTEDGYLIPKAAGNVTITANADGETDTLELTIDDTDLGNISFETPDANVDLNGNLKLKVNGEDTNGVELENLQNIDFEVSDESIATVDAEGNVTPKQPGTITVTASSDNYEDEITITVADNDSNSNGAVNNNDWDSSNGDSDNNWNSSSDRTTNTSNMSDSDSLTTPGVPSTGDGSSQNSMSWSWMVLGLLALTGTSVFAWRKQQQV